MEPVKNPSAVDQAILALVDNLKQGKDFVLEQAPDVIQQLIVYRTVREVAYLVLGGILLGIAWKLSRLAKKYWPTNTYDDGCAAVLSTIGSAAAAILGFLTIFDASLCLLKLTLAPKVWLLEYAARLVQQVA